MLYGWIRRFFRYFIVPNIPIDQIPPVEPDFNNHSVAKHTKSMVQGGIDKIIDHYPYLKTTNESWVNIPNWLWYTGVAVLSIGGLYITYYLITSPEFISWISPDTKGPSTPPIDTQNIPDITINDARTGDG